LNAENNTGNNEEKVEEISLQRRFLNYRTLISFVIAVGILVLVFERLDVNFGATWDMITRCNPVFYTFAFFSHYLTFPLRAVRWRLLLQSAGYRKEEGVVLPSYWGLTQIIIINWFANSIIYGRLGDPYRAYLLKDAADVSFSKSVGTVVAERFLDIIVIFLLLMVAIFGLLLTGGGGMTTAGIILAVGSVMLLIIAIILGLMGHFGSSLERRLPHRLKPIYSLFEEGTLASLHRLPAIGSLSVGIWLLEAGRLFLVIQALSQATGSGVFEIGLPLILFAALANALITAIPLTPGGLGLVEPGVAGLLMIGPISRGVALSIVLLDRTISFLSVIIIGMLVFLLWHLTQARRMRAR
jgi:hypothetical protein